MIAQLRQRLFDQSGNTGIAVVVAAPALLFMMFALVSAQQHFDARRQAQAISSEAARIGAQPGSDLVRAHNFSAGSWRMSPDSILSAQQYVDGHEDVSLDSLTEKGDLLVEAQVTIEIDYIFAFGGLSNDVTMTSTARVLRGVEEGL